MLDKIKDKLVSQYFHAKYANKGFKTNRKILVFESDDWGSVRMPNKQTYNALLKKGVRVDKCRYAKYDSLASIDDFNSLYEVLLKYKDHKGNHPVITANTIVANPDFEKIRQFDYREYFYEPFTTTLQRYDNHSFDLWKKGIELGVFWPQFHGREHLNIAKWLYKLQSGDKDFLTCFDYGFFALSGNMISGPNPKITASLSIFKNLNEINQHLSLLKEGMSLFNDIFNFNPKSFMATNHRWNPSHEQALAELGVKYLQGDFNHKEPYLPGKEKRKYHFIGQKNIYNQLYLVRNCKFEPTSYPGKDWVDSCLKEIQNAYENKRPAIICTHRINFIGYLEQSNRQHNLNLLNLLLKKVIEKYPDVEFMTSDQLGNAITENYKL